MAKGTLLNMTKLFPSILFTQPVRWAGVKKKPDYTDRPSKYRPSVLVRTLRGFQFNDGDYVYKDDILVRQLGLEIYPGESVRYDRQTCDLIATANGRFTISTEQLKPYPDSPLYSKVKNGTKIERPFVHVLPTDSEKTEPYFVLKRFL